MEKLKLLQYNGVYIEVLLGLYRFVLNLGNYCLQILLKIGGLHRARFKVSGGWVVRHLENRIPIRVVPFADYAVKISLRKCEK